MVPSRWSSPARHFEVLGEYEVATRLISGSIISFIVEQTRSHFHHACTIDDIATSIIEKESGTQFDPDIVATFLKIDDRFLTIRKQFEEKMEA